MKAILQYGQFTSMIELPSRMHTVYILKPNEVVSYAPLEEKFDTAIDDRKKLEFHIREQLTADIALYEFVSES